MFGSLQCEAKQAQAAAAPDTTIVGTKNAKYYTGYGNRKVLAPLALETNFDVVIVGGGIIGMATARGE